MPAPLSIAVAQPSTTLSDVAANARAHADAVLQAGARVVVFPEMSLTGYVFAAPAVEPADPRLAPLVEACRRTGSLALVGAPVAAGDGTTIGILEVTGAGARVAYRKMYLGGAEADAYVPGTGPAAIAVDGWRLGLAVCRDTGIPDHAAACARLGMDAYVAGVLEFAADAAVPDERARRVARDQGVWVAIASFAGEAGGDYRDTAGGSGIWAPDGAVVARAGSEPGAIARALLTRPPAP